jgi:hypothetical protein
MQDAPVPCFTLKVCVINWVSITYFVLILKSFRPFYYQGCWQLYTSRVPSAKKKFENYWSRATEENYQTRRDGYRVRDPNAIAP